MLNVSLLRVLEGKVNDMKSNLTEKDKRLLLFMFLFVIVVGIGYWGILPQIKQFNTLENEIDKETVKQSINEQKVMNLFIVEDQCTEYEEAMAEDKTKFYDMMTEADIDRMLTSNAVSNGLEVFSFSVNIPDKPSSRMAYIYSDLYQRQLEYEAERKLTDKEISKNNDDEELLNEASGKKSSKDQKEEKVDIMKQEVVDVFGNADAIGVNTDIYAARVTISLGGDEAALHRFLNQMIDSDKKVLITAYNWGEYKTTKEVKTKSTEDDEKETTTKEVVIKKSLTITMEFYMCKQIEETSAEAEEE